MTTESYEIASAQVGNLTESEVNEINESLHSEVPYLTDEELNDLEQQDLAWREKHPA
jgi:hypothetical protein